MGSSLPSQRHIILCLEFRPRLYLVQFLTPLARHRILLVLPRLLRDISFPPCLGHAKRAPKSDDGSLLNSEIAFANDVDVELSRILALPRETRPLPKPCVLSFKVEGRDMGACSGGRS